MENIITLLTKEELGFITYKKAKKCEIIHHEEEMCDLVGILIKGRLLINSYTFEGKEIIYNEIHEGQVYGNNLIFSSDPTYKGDVIAKEDSLVAQIKKDNLIHLFQTNKDFLIAYLGLQSDFSKSLNAKIKILNFSSPEDRLLYYLQINNNKIKVNSITELSKNLNVARETLSRLINKLIKENIISYQNKIMIKIG